MGLAFWRSYPAALVKPTTNRFAKKLQALGDGKGHERTICVNDGVGSHDNSEWEHAVRSFLGKRFPTATVMEKLEDDTTHSEMP